MASPTASTSNSARLAPLLLLVCLVAGFFLRAHQLEARGFTPDEGNYLESAGIHKLSAHAPASGWLKEDIRWFKGEQPYPHSHLHQLLARYSFRTGVSSKRAVRMGSVLLGLLTGLVLYRFYRRFFVHKPWVGALGGAFCALSCLDVWYSRTGWGATGATFFLALYYWAAWSTYRSDTTRGFVRGGLAMAAASLCAFGFHEMASVYVVGMGVFMLLSVRLDEPRPGSYFRQLWHSGALRAWVLASVPIGLLTLNLLLFSPFAQQHWFDPVRGEMSYFAAKWTVFSYLFNSKGGIHLQVGLPLIGLALVGAAQLFKSERRFFTFIAANSFGSFLLFLFCFQDANLIRIHLPLVFFVHLLAAEGLVTLVKRTRGALRPVVLGAAGLLLLAQPMRTASTVFGAPGDPLFDRSFHAASRVSLLAEAKRTEQPLIDYLKLHLAPDERVTVRSLVPLFFLRDGRIRSSPYDRNLERYVIGRAATTGDFIAHTVGPGQYVKVELDSADYWGLYERVDSRPHSSSPK